MKVELIGYLALGLGILAMSMKKMVVLRLIHGASALAYMIYGHLIDATPVLVAGILFMFIHSYQIFHLLSTRKSI